MIPFYEVLKQAKLSYARNQGGGAGVWIVWKGHEGTFWSDGNGLRVRVVVPRV